MQHQIKVEAYDGRSLSRIQYGASGPWADYARDPLGRLQSLIVDGVDVVTSVQFDTLVDIPNAMTLGSSIERTDVYDVRKRLLERRYTVGGVSLAELRYTYDAADQATAEQHVHQAGRTTAYDYDLDGRLAAAELFLRPGGASASGLGPPISSPGGWSLVALPPSGGWDPGDYGREYSFSGADHLDSTTLHIWPNMSALPVAQSLSSPYAMGHPTDVDGRTRTFDGMGHVTGAYGQQGAMTLSYDAMSRLRRVETSSAHIDYVFRADGALAHRDLTCPPPPGGLGMTGPGVSCTPSSTTYVYDGLQLMEVHKTEAGQTWMSARYYYADEGDIPIAAHLAPVDGAMPALHFFVTDRMGSVIGVLDSAGAWVERIRYDPWGGRIVQAADVWKPDVSAVLSHDGDLFVVFSEQVHPRLSGTADANGLFTTLATANSSGELSGVRVDGNTVPARLEYLDGYPVGSVVRVPGSYDRNVSYSITIAADTLVDDWNNGNDAVSVAVTFDDPASPPTPRLLHTDVTVGSTRPPEVDRSTVGNEVGFQAHLHDPDAGLILMRARAYDPTVGQFLQPDPEGHADSVNLYAGMAWDPVNLRDPTGRQSRKEKSCINGYCTCTGDGCTDEDFTWAGRQYRRAGRALGRAGSWLASVYQKYAPNIGLTEANRVAEELAENKARGLMTDTLDTVRDDRIDYYVSRSEADRAAKEFGRAGYRTTRDSAIGTAAGPVVGRAGRALGRNRSRATGGARALRSPVRSRHYTHTEHGRRLHAEAQKYRARHRDGGNRHRNFVAADVEVDGRSTTVFFKNDPGGMHSEHRLIAWHERMIERGRDIRVHRVYSERPPCGPMRANCEDTLSYHYGSDLEVYHGDR